jgi:phage terminase small subunit
MDLPENRMSKKDVFNTPPILGNKLQQRLTTKVAPLKRQKTLTGREWKFVQELVSGDGEVTMKEAAIRAGYPEKSAKTKAWKLTNAEISPHVVAAIQSYRAELNAKYGTTFERHMKDLQRIRDAALQAGAYGAAVQAEYRRGQALGTIYVERKEVRFGTIDSMSKEEVMRELEKIKQLYGGPPPKEIIDIEPAQVIESIEHDPPEFNANEVLNGDQTRGSIVQADSGEPAGQSHNADRIAGEPGDS